MIVVTGATGFIGKHFMASINRPTRAIVREGSLYNFDYCDVVEANLSSLSLYKILEDVDTVIHLAGLAHKKFTPEEYEENYVSFKNVILSAAKARVKRIVYVSSISIFEGCRSAEISNDLEPSPISMSSNYKYKSELLLRELARSEGVEFVIIRSPLVYGEGVKANFSSLMKLVGKGFPLPFRSINHNKRSLVSVYNLVDLIKVCIDHPKATNLVFLVSDDNDLSTSQMVALMANVQCKANLSIPIPVWCFKIAGKVLKKEAMVDRLVGSLQLDIEHTKNTLDWVPPYSVEHGFKLATVNLSK